jgi:hypothetical protein
MDTPPSISLLERSRQQEPFITLPTKVPTYVPRYEWVDDERSKRAYVSYYDGEEESYHEYVPVFQIMKELYDEEKRALYRSNSWSSTDDAEYWDYQSETYEPVTTSDDEHVVDYPIQHDNNTHSLTLPKEQENFKSSTNEMNDDAVDVSGNKFAYT